MSPVNLLSTTLYSGTVFTLTCIVELISAVDTTVSVLTTWSKNGMNITNTSRITVDSLAVHNTTTTFIYESDIVFNPLSNMTSEEDDGQYTCSVQVKDSEYINGSSNSFTQNITVEG